MLSFQTSLFPGTGKTVPELENLLNSKKRKLEEPLDDEDEETLLKRPKAESMESLFDMDLHLETPLPLEWQRCLDLQSGQIHFYNTRTHTKTSMDPRRSHEPPSTGHMSLDLELNLPCDSLRNFNATDQQLVSVSPMRVGLVDRKINSGSISGGLMGNLPWLAEEEEAEEERQEMVATVCRRCHMLVMLIKSAPTCPNCKYMHPSDQGPPKLFNQRLSLMC